MPDPSRIRDHALASLYGLAMGDALGMPTQTLSPDVIAERYGRIEGFVAPFPDHPVSHGLPAGAITDDTEQALLLARRLIGQPTWDARGWAQDLIGWEDSVRARGLRDLLGPSTKRALQALLDGADPHQTGRQGNTNGAAMRIAPVGIATPPDIAQILDVVEETCRVTHATTPAIAAAAAVAGTISAAIEGADWRAALQFGMRCAVAARDRGVRMGEADLADRIEMAIRLAGSPGASAALLAAQLGSSVLASESVPCAFGLVALTEADPWRCGLLAAGIGDDTDTIGAIACAIAGACRGMDALPAAAVERLRRVNRLDLGPVIDGLIALRRR